MSTRILKISLLLIIAFNLSCNTNEAKLEQFKYADQKETITCNTGYDAILKEALYTFESDIINKYDPKQKNKLRAYRAYISNYISNRTALQETVSPHTKAVFDVLKSKKTLWNGKQLNYSSPEVTCIIDNLNDKNLKQTIQSLLSVNSMSSDLFAAPLRSSTAYSRDAYLATFVALDLYYSKLHDIDFSKVDLTANTPKPEPIDFNKTPAKTPLKVKEPINNNIDHTGHNHN
ncbi:hypothetical protein JAO71_14425 [Olleya sp. YSTF-M6]|uniref:Lipoprotein n=1 Tax=Olleya sediminilitoris TaxID=2795739 RepID=A0ABS1WPG9_9FLAO|nr:MULTISPECIES: hypothetical protein [Olleya]MBL7560998.1 hypothetical protein [Olleya sediminilitoris]